jgi:hypothetical protein
MAAVEDLQSPARGGEPVPEGEEASPEAVPDLPASGPEPDSAEEDTLEPESAEEEALEPESEEAPVLDPDPDATQVHDVEAEEPTLLVDPDAEDETPPHGNVR